MSEHLADNCRPVRHPELRAETLEGELFLYSFEDLRAVYCNETARLVWDLCDGSRTVAEIIGLLADAYPDHAAEIGDDVRGALALLRSQGALGLE